MHSVSKTFVRNFMSTRQPFHTGQATNIKWHHGLIDKYVKDELLRQKGCVLWMTGLSGSGKSTLACMVERALTQRGNLCTVLDGDNMRHGLNSNLGFSDEDRKENVRRVGEVAKLFADTGVISIVSLVSPFRNDRLLVRNMFPIGEFHEIFVDAPLHVCEQRDPKGLYQLSREGKIDLLTGVDSPYQVPENPELSIRSDITTSPEDSTRIVLNYLRRNNVIRSM